MAAAAVALALALVTAPAGAQETVVADREVDATSGLALLADATGGSGSTAVANAYADLRLWNGTWGSGEIDDVAELAVTTDSAIAEALDVAASIYPTVEDAYAVAVGSTDTAATIETIGGWNDASAVRFSDLLYPGSLTNVRNQIGVPAYWKAGATGRGIDIAIIDSGIVPVPGLDDPSKIVNGPDLSFESQVTSLRYMDTFGHGAHLAGIMVGESENLTGIAPDARLVNLKVASHDGAVDVTQMIAAIDWVVQHRNDGGLNIRVLNLSYGTQALHAYESDALAHAVEQAWNAGIVVVAAAGNDGPGVPLRSPAYNPTVIAVGAVDGGLLGTDGDAVADFSSCGLGDRAVDVVAPGRSIVSYRNPGSFADVNYPLAKVGEDLFMGSGTSQATAVVAGAVALVLDRHPGLTPDQVKGLLAGTATKLAGATPVCQGSGLINLASALAAVAPGGSDLRAPTEGLGRLDATRGGAFVQHEGVVLTGNFDIFGAPFAAAEWAKGTANGSTWTGGVWNGNIWTGDGWSGKSWTTQTWVSVLWAAPSWSGGRWASDDWAGGSWSGGSWSGGSWSGGSWSGGSWSGGSWAGGSWSGGSWSGGSWSGGSWS
ncbi:MAG: S8 family serine peptidase [Acidimicrobiia bacterium]|nr:S8 family serine peptidase [Acidimicrobiia bacterium]